MLTNSLLDCMTSSTVFLPTSLLIFQAEKIWPWLKISSTSSSVLCAVSGKQKKIWMHAAKLKVAKMKYV